MTARSQGTVAAIVAVLLAALLGACTSGVYAETQVWTSTATPATPSTSGTATAAPAACDNATQSYDPLPSLTGDAANNAVAAIRKNDRLRVGVSADSLLLASRNPLTGQIEGFDIDMAKAVAQAILGNPDKIELIVIPASDRIPALKENRVDIVARNMTMTCARWQDIAFSAEYYLSGLKILVPKGSDVTSLTQLPGKKVCAPAGTSTLDFVKATAGVIPVPAATHTGCLVLFQNGNVDAIAGDDTVLAGLVAQDPYASVPAMDRLTSEPYGIGVNKDQKDLVRYVNRVLETVKADGRWKASYDRWFLPRLKVEAQPPQPVYGRA
ncbi:MAG: glutamate ABC transporter substrate-binding protein [Lapillicoccus sp.]